MQVFVKEVDAERMRGHQWAVVTVDDDLWLLVQREDAVRTGYDVAALNAALAVAGGRQP